MCVCVYVCVCTVIYITTTFTTTIYAYIIHTCIHAYITYEDGAIRGLDESRALHLRLKLFREMYAVLGNCMLIESHVRGPNFADTAREEEEEERERERERESLFVTNHVENESSNTRD